MYKVSHVRQNLGRDFQDLDRIGRVPERHSRKWGWFRVGGWGGTEDPQNLFPFHRRNFCFNSCALRSGDGKCTLWTRHRPRWGRTAWGAERLAGREEGILCQQENNGGLSIWWQEGADGLRVVRTGLLTQLCNSHGGGGGGGRDGERR